MPEVAGIVVVIEGSSDLLVVRGFAETALREVIPEFAPEWFSWRGLEEHNLYLRWQDVELELERRKVPKVYGKFPGAVVNKYAYRARSALQLCHLANPLAVILVCDADTQPERLDALKQARDNHFSQKYPVVVGVANPCREAWLVCSYTPQTELDRKRLEALTQSLSFHPCRQPERLNTADGTRNAKKVLEQLLGETEETELFAAMKYPHLLECGTECGLAACLSEIQTKLSPLLGMRT
jgi:hypothetical protein